MSLQLPQNASPTKINDLVVAGSVQPTDVTVIVQNGVMKQAAASQFADAVVAGSQTANVTLSAIAAMSATVGMMAFLGAGNVTAVTLTGTTGELTVMNGQGSAAPTFSLPTALVFTGKTIAQGTFSAPILNNPVINGGTISATAINATSLTVSGAATITGALTLGVALTIQNGGTGATTQASAALNILPSITGNAAKFLQVNAGETAVQWTSAASGAAAAANLAIASNRLYNGDFSFQQFSASTADAGYVADETILLLGAANAATASQISASLPFNLRTGLRLTVGTGNNNKFGIMMPIEGFATYDLRGRSVTGSGYLRATTGLSDIRMAVVNWAGTQDSITRDIVSTWNAQGTVPTLAANWSYANTPTNLTVSATFGAVYSVSASVASAATNLGLFIWNEDTTTSASTDMLDITGVILEAGSTPSTWDRPAPDAAFQAARRYYRVLIQGTPAAFRSGGIVATTTLAYTYEMIMPPMRTSPTVVISNSTDFTVYDAGATPSCTSFVATVYPLTIQFDWNAGAGGLTAGRAANIYTNSATALLALDARL